MLMRSLVLAVILVACFATAPAHARDAAPALNFLLDQFNQEIGRQQQRKIERQIRKNQQRDHKLFLAAWSDCFDRGDIARCNLALEYPLLDAGDRARLLDRREQILANQARTIEQAERERREAAEASERQRQARVQEERRLAARRDYAAAVGGCRAYVIDRCDTALASSFASIEDAAKLRAWRATASAYAADRAACQSRSIQACDTALRSPALSESDRPLLTSWRNEISPLLRDAAFVMETVRAAPHAMSSLPSSTLVTGGVAGVLAIAVALLAFRRSPTPTSSPPQSHKADRSNTPRWIRQLWLPSAKPTQVRPPPLPTTSAAVQPPPLPDHVAVTNAPPTKSVDSKFAAEPAVIDTPAAQRALRLAYAYLLDASSSTLSDEDATRADRTTLSLAGKQLDIAHRADPNARLEVDDDDGTGSSVTQARLRARVLALEALSWSLQNLSRACAIAERATTADPTCSESWRVLGLLHYENRNKQAAVAALTRASELDPDNIDIMKLLDRAQNMGLVEVVGFKATRVGIGVANAGIGVYNTGVVTWNIFAFTWNVVTAPLRFVLWIAHGGRR